MFIVDCRNRIEIDSDSFPKFIPEYASNIIASVSDSMSDILGVLNRRIVIKRSERNHPYYNPGDKEVARIFLCTDGDDEYLWLYQFSHELTHAYIDSWVPGYTLGLWWFEEVICCLASHYYLVLFDSESGGKPLRESHPSNPRSALHLQYIRDSKPSGRMGVWYSGKWEWMDRMAVPKHGYNASAYRYFDASAVDILPLFLEDKRLWKITRYMMFVRIHHSLESFLDECEPRIDDSWKSSFYKLKHYLLYRTKDFYIFVGEI